jgi:hypothetical protein
MTCTTPSTKHQAPSTKHQAPSTNKLIGFALAATFALAACGGGGGGSTASGDPSPDPNPVPSATLYQFYKGNSLVAVNPDNPTETVVVENESVDVLTKLYTGTVDTVEQTVSDINATGLVYAKGGKLWYVSAAPADGFVPRQVSSEASACPSGYGEEGVVGFDPASARIFYFSGGANGVCENGNFDDVYHMIQPTMTTTDAPIEADYPEAPEYPMFDADLNLIGWLVNNANGGITRLGPDFDNPVETNDLGQLIIPDGWKLARNFVQTDSGVYYFNPTMLTFDGPIVTNAIEISAYDENYFYYVSNRNLYRVSLTDFTESTMATNITPVGGFGTDVWPTDNHVLVHWVTEGDVLLGTQPSYGLESVAKSNDAVTTVIPARENGLLLLAMSSGDRLYTGSFDTSTGTRSTLTIDSGSLVSEHLNGYWAAFTISSTQSLLRAAYGLVNVDNLIEIVDSNDDGMMAGETMQLINASTGTSSEYGVVPDNVRNFGFMGHGRKSLANATFFDGVSYQSDVYLIDILTPGSLQRITSTADVSESFVL